MRRRGLRRIVLGVAVTVFLILGAAGLVYRDQIGRYATHLKGSPEGTATWEPFAPDGPPELHLAVAGDVGNSGGRLDATAEAISQWPQSGSPESSDSSEA